MVACLPGTDLSRYVKVLDLLTNRYYLGMVREAWGGGLHIELPAGARFQPGQRIHFALADRPVVARGDMQRACITGVSQAAGQRLSLQLSILPQTAVA